MHAENEKPADARSKKEPMEAVTRLSLGRAVEEAVTLWSLCSTQWPPSHQLVSAHATSQMLEALSSFSLNARRALEVFPELNPTLSHSRWNWQPKDHSAVIVQNLRNALDRVIHAKKLIICFDSVPAELSVMDGGTVAITAVRIETDRREMAYVDPFSMAFAFIYEALPAFDVTT